MIQRLDKFLCDSGLGTRKDVKHLIRSGRVCVNGVSVFDESRKEDYQSLTVTFDGKEVVARHSVLGVLYKTSGYVTSTDDPENQTVMSLIPEEFIKAGVFPVGRLDKDTEGVLLFTNDGNLAHKLISPKKNIEKTYYAVFEGSCPEDAGQRCSDGIVLKDGSVCKSSSFELISDHEFRITITQGMYHQVRRMASSMGMHITYLKREKFAGIGLEGLEKGQFKELDFSVLQDDAL